MLVKKDCPKNIGGQYLFIQPLKNNSKSCIAHFKSQDKNDDFLGQTGVKIGT